MRIPEERIQKLFDSFADSFNTEYMMKEVPEMIWNQLMEYPIESIELGKELVPFLVKKVDKAKVVEGIKDHTRKTHAENSDITSIKDIEERLISFHGALERMADTAIRGVVIHSVATFLEEVNEMGEDRKK